MLPQEAYEAHALQRLREIRASDSGMRAVEYFQAVAVIRDLLLNLGYARVVTEFERTVQSKQTP